VTSQNLWSRYDRHVVGISWHDVWSYKAKICGVIHVKLEPVSFQKCPHDHLLYNKAYLSGIIVASIFQIFTCKMAAKTSWHKYGTKLRHSHPMYINSFFLLPVADRSGWTACNATRLILPGFFLTHDVNGCCGINLGW